MTPEPPPTGAPGRVRAMAVMVVLLGSMVGAVAYAVMRESTPIGPGGTRTRDDYYQPSPDDDAGFDQHGLDDDLDHFASPGNRNGSRLHRGGTVGIDCGLDDVPGKPDPNLLWHRSATREPERGLVLSGRRHHVWFVLGRRRVESLVRLGLDRAARRMGATRSGDRGHLWCL